MDDHQTFVAKLEGFSSFQALSLPFTDVFDNSEWAAHALVTLLNKGLVTRDQVEEAYQDYNITELVEKFCDVSSQFLYECDCDCNHCYYRVTVSLK